MIRKIFFNSIIYGLGPQIPKMAGLFILPFITPFLTEKDFGIFGVITAYSLAFANLKMLGFPFLMTNVFLKHPSLYKVVWRHYMGFLHIWSVFLGCLLAVVIFAALPATERHNAPLIIFLNVVPLIIFSTGEGVYFRYYQLSKRPIPVTIRIVVTGLVNVLFNYYTIAVLKLGYLGWFYSTFFAGVISFLLIVYPVYIKHNFTPIFQLRWNYLKSRLVMSASLLPHYYSNYILNSSDRVVMDILDVRIEAIGQYNIAYMVGNYFTIIATSINKAFSPFLQESYLSNDAAVKIKMRNFIFLLQIIFILGTFVFCIWTKELLPLVFRNDSFKEVYFIAIIIVMACNYMPMYIASNTQLFFFERTNSLWKRALFAGALNIGLNIIFIPRYGIVAAAVNTFIAYMIVGYSTFLMKEYKEIRRIKYFPLVWLFLTVIALVSALLIVELDSIIKMIFTAVFGLSIFVMALNIKRIKSRVKRYVR